jgi:hypothetical protein
VGSKSFFGKEYELPLAGTLAKISALQKIKKGLTVGDINEIGLQKIYNNNIGHFTVLYLQSGFF